MKSNADIQAYLRDNAALSAAFMSECIAGARNAGFSTMEALLIASLACQEVLFISHALPPGNMTEHKEHFQALGEFLLSEANRISENEKIHKHAQNAKNQILALDAGEFGNVEPNN